MKLRLLFLLLLAAPCQAQVVISATAKELVQVDLAITTLPACTRGFYTTRPRPYSMETADSFRDLDSLDEPMTLFYRWYQDRMTWIITVPYTDKVPTRFKRHKLNKFINSDSLDLWKKMNNRLVVTMKVRLLEEAKNSINRHIQPKQCRIISNRVTVNDLKEYEVFSFRQSYVQPQPVQRQVVCFLLSAHQSKLI